MQKKRQAKKQTTDYNKLTWGVLSWILKVIVIILVAALFFVGITKGYAFGMSVFNSAALTDEANRVSMELVIEEGDGAYGVGKDLEQMGIIEDALVFLAQSYLYQIKISPGTYEVGSDMSTKDILYKIHEAYVEEELR